MAVGGNSLVPRCVHAWAFERENKNATKVTQNAYDGKKKSTSTSYMESWKHSCQ